MSAYAFAEKPVSNFPGKHGGVILLVLCNRINNMGRGYFGFAATDHTGFVIASLIEPAKKGKYIEHPNKSTVSKKFVYSEKATKFCKISTVDLSYVVPVKSTVEISQKFVVFSKYMNFT